ncbi:hypothetical protein O6H91_08G045400 [Diphasiastrum complanatum]|uniref:Uncharacterized protein n=1 Tax=Diphasiastrum complanatum TaxID=34168 RepID=A0ACC2CX27_DIPCM|nr:hypothetical protein O6H91_08G045400 [Diphasiastrum complanatum]
MYLWVPKDVNNNNSNSNASFDCPQRGGGNSPHPPMHPAHEPRPAVIADPRPASIADPTVPRPASIADPTVPATPSATDPVLAPVVSPSATATVLALDQVDPFSLTPQPNAYASLTIQTPVPGTPRWENGLIFFQEIQFLLRTVARLEEHIVKLQAKIVTQGQQITNIIQYRDSTEVPHIRSIDKFLGRKEIDIQLPPLHPSRMSKRTPRISPNNTRKHGPMFSKVT